MKRPSTQTMVVGHPIIAVPMTLVSGICLLAGFHGGSVLFVLIAIGMIAKFTSASQQASAYRAWKADWDAMGGEPERRAVRPIRILGIVLVVILALAAFTMPRELAGMAGYAVGWIVSQHWLLAFLGLLVVAVVVQFIRRIPRRAKPTRTVTVIAKPILPVPPLADAYRALPPYCQHLLRGLA